MLFGFLNRLIIFVFFLNLDDLPIHLNSHILASCMMFVLLLTHSYSFLRLDSNQVHYLTIVKIQPERMEGSYHPCIATYTVCKVVEQIK
jgi:hypothetical protein